jgi:hypothetical protein
MYIFFFSALYLRDLCTKKQSDIYMNRSLPAVNKLCALIIQWVEKKGGRNENEEKEERERERGGSQNICDAQ